MAMFGNRKGGNPFAPNALRAYQPTARDRAANALLGVIGDGYEQQRFVENLFGSSGLGQTKTGAADFTPLGGLFMGDEGGRKVANGNVFGGLADVGLAAVPVPAAIKGAKGMFGAGERLVAKTLPKPEVIDRSLAARMERAHRSGYTVPAYHGTTQAFEQFDPALRGSATRVDDAKGGFFFTDNPRSAEAFLPPVLVDGEKGTVGGNIRPVLLRLPKKAVNDPWDFHNGVTNERNMKPVMRDVKRRGAAILERAQDFGFGGGNGYIPPSTHYVMRDAADIRSLFDDFADPPPQTTARRLPDGGGKTRR